MNACTTPRAAKGGEFGANGEWYEGGKFINTVKDNRKREGSKPSKVRKCEIEPYVWVEQIGLSIYQQLAGVYGRVENGRMVLRTDDRLPQTLAYYRRTIEEVTALVDRYNAGDRWV